MTSALIPLFTVGTPYPQASQVTLYQHVWEKHILPNRPDLNGNQDWIRQTLIAPTYICAGTTDPNHIAFLNHAIVSSGTSSPLGVFVHPINQMVVTAGYRRDFRNVAPHTILWTPLPGSG